jgi:hypothetical protein
MHWEVTNNLDVPMSEKHAGRRLESVNQGQHPSAPNTTYMTDPTQAIIFLSSKIWVGLGI